MAPGPDACGGGFKYGMEPTPLSELIVNGQAAPAGFHQHHHHHHAAVCGPVGLRKPVAAGGAFAQHCGKVAPPAVVGPSPFGTSPSPPPRQASATSLCVAAPLQAHSSYLNLQDLCKDCSPDRSDFLLPEDSLTLPDEAAEPAFLSVHDHTFDTPLASLDIACPASMAAPSIDVTLFTAAAAPAAAGALPSSPSSNSCTAEFQKALYCLARVDVESGTPMRAATPEELDELSCILSCSDAFFPTAEAATVAAAVVTTAGPTGAAAARGNSFLAPCAPGDWSLKPATGPSIFSGVASVAGVAPTFAQELDDPFLPADEFMGMYGDGSNDHDTHFGSSELAEGWQDKQQQQDLTSALRVEGPSPQRRFARFASGNRSAGDLSAVAAAEALEPPAQLQLRYAGGSAVGSVAADVGVVMGRGEEAMAVAASAATISGGEGSTACLGGCGGGLSAAPLGPHKMPHHKSGGPCDHCQATESPQWRRGPTNKPVLCNACGTRFRRTNCLGPPCSMAIAKAGRGRAANTPVASAGAAAAAAAPGKKGGKRGAGAAARGAAKRRRAAAARDDDDDDGSS